MDGLTEFIGLVIIILILLWIYGTKNYNYWQKRGIVNKKPFFPFFGNTTPDKFAKPVLELFKELYHSFPNEPYVGVYFLTTPAILLRDPDLIKSIMVTDFTSFVDRGFHYNTDKDPFSHTIVQLYGNDWKFLRSKLQATFGTSKLKSMVVEMDNLAKDMLELIETENASTQGCIPFNASNFGDRYMIDVFSLCGFSIKSNAIKDHEKSEFYQISKHTFNGYNFLMHLFIGYFWPKIHKLFGITIARKYVARFFIDLTKQLLALRKRANTESDKKDLLDVLMKMMEDDQKHSSSEGKGDLTEEDFQTKQNEMSKMSIVFDEKFVAGNIFFFFSAGFEASSKVSAFTLFELANNEEIQNKAREEILNVLSTCDNKLTMESVQKLTYLDQIVSEANRKYTTLSILFRKCAKRYQMPDGGIIEPGTPVMTPASAIHFDPIYFPNPEVFDPERFNEENKGNIHPATYIPFGMGPKICLAWQFSMIEMKVYLARILSQYHVTLHPSSTEYPLKLDPTAFLRGPLNNIYVNLKKIQ